MLKLLLFIALLANIFLIVSSYTPLCSANETFVDCPEFSCEPQTCAELGYPVACPTAGPDDTCPGEPDCICNSGLVRNKQGTCIPSNKCPSCGGDRNATAGCGVNCGRLCSNYKNSDVVCIEICFVNACDCKKGYVYDDVKNQCVRPNDCTCGNNEQYSTCTNSGCSPQKCSEKGKPVPCVKIDPKYCKTGCVCMEGYLRNNKGECVPEDECPVKCGNNEYLDSCANGGCYSARNCSQLGDPTICVDPIKCKPGCLCKDGYLRDDKTGNCIPKGQCPKPKCKGPNEYFACGGACDNVCATLSRQNQTNCPIKNIKCNDMCYCKKGYARNSKGICIPISQCPKLDCFRQNEEFNPCPNSCPPNNCESIGKKYPCPFIPTVVTPEYCNASCVCKPGYFRNYLGDCISRSNCLKCTGPNEYFSCGGECDNVCLHLSEYNQTNCPFINVKCNEKCYCKPGYARDNTGICIPIDQCPVSCGGDPNAQPGCGTNCGRHCYDYKNKYYVCPYICKENGCDCKPDYVYDPVKAKCVAPKYCTCGNNEQYSNCTNGAGPQTCAEKGKGGNYKKPSHQNCKKGCICMAGYLRNAKGECVPENQCFINCGQNEYIDTCANGGCYSSRNCSQLGNPVICVDVTECIPGCLCNDGYLRDDKTGRCVPKNQCPKALVCKGPNEHYECGPECDNVCATLSRQNKTNCPIVNIVCNDKCYCNDGYARDDKGKCIPIDHCPTLDCCRPNEEFDACPYTCPPNTCESLGKAYACPIIPIPVTPEDCTASCVCKPGFYRNYLGDCISEQDCLKCSGPKEYYSCGGACDNVCSTLKEQNQTNCPIVNIKCNEMCYCEDDYARAENGTCIPIEDCPPTCETDEYYSTCPPESVDDDYCPTSSYEEQDGCGSPRCVCGFNRRRCPLSAKCINICDCPQFPCDGQNEEYVCCPPLCPSENCSTYINNSTCIGRIGIILPCNPQCRCKEGYYRNNQGVCIPGPECLKENECTATTDCSAINKTAAMMELERGLAIFNARFLKEVAGNTTDNKIMSAVSVQVLLAVLAPYSFDDTFTQIADIIGIDSKDKIRCIFKEFLSAFQNQKNIITDIAVKVYVNEFYPLSSGFQDYTRDVFNATAENVDCSKPEETATIINTWVEDRTNDKIHNLILPEMITVDTRAILVDAIYFKGIWKYQFNTSDTEEQTFYVTANTPVQTKMMYQKRAFRYVESDELNAKMLELPFENTDYTCLFVLPYDLEGLDNLINAIQDIDKFNNAKNSLVNQTLEVWLPLMEIDTTVALREVLQALGMTDAFGDNAKFDCILAEKEPLYISDAVHKGYVKLDEEGAEAAAATAIIFTTTAAMYPPPPKPEFRADHPFFFCIYHEDHAQFCGTYRNAD